MWSGWGEADLSMCIYESVSVSISRQGRMQEIIGKENIQITNIIKWIQMSSFKIWLLVPWSTVNGKFTHTFFLTACQLIAEE